MSIRRDITSTRLLIIKASLFVLLGCVAVAMILVEVAKIRLALLLMIAIWAFCRAYYFCFYVIEHYVDPAFRFAGLFSAVRYLLRRQRVGRERDDRQ